MNGNTKTNPLNWLRVYLIPSILFAILLWGISCTSSNKSTEDSNTLQVTKLDINESGTGVILEGELLMFSNVQKPELLSYLYQDFYNKDSVQVDFSKDDLSKTLTHLAKESLKEYDYLSTDSVDHPGIPMELHWNMDLVFGNKHFICTRLHQQSLMYSHQELVTYRNIDYQTGEVVQLSDIIDPKSLTEEKLKEYFNNYAEDSSGRHIQLQDVNATAISLPDNFSFDQKALYFVFQKYEIGFGYQGYISFKIPYWEIEDLLKPEFKAKIDVSHALEVKYSRSVQ